MRNLAVAGRRGLLNKGAAPWIPHLRVRCKSLIDGYLSRNRQNLHDSNEYPELTSPSFASTNFPARSAVAQPTSRRCATAVLRAEHSFWVAFRPAYQLRNATSAAPAGSRRGRYWNVAFACVILLSAAAASYANQLMTPFCRDEVLLPMSGCPESQLCVPRRSHWHC